MNDAGTTVAAVGGGVFLLALGGVLWLEMGDVVFAAMAEFGTLLCQ